MLGRLAFYAKLRATHSASPKKASQFQRFALKLELYFRDEQNAKHPRKLPRERNKWFKRSASKESPVGRTGRKDIGKTGQAAERRSDLRER